MDDVGVVLVRHITGEYDPALGQLCMRCGLVLDEGEIGKMYAVPPGVEDFEPPHGWPPGEAVMVAAGFQCLESALLPIRDRSDEADCSLGDTSPRIS